MPEDIDPRKITECKPEDLDISQEIAGALKVIYPPQRIPRVVLLPVEAFGAICPEFFSEYGSRHIEDYPYVLVCNGVMMPSIMQ